MHPQEVKNADHRIQFDSLIIKNMKTVYHFGIIFDL